MKSMINFLKGIIIILLIIGCNKKEKDYPINSITLKDKDYYENLALTKGDTSAYSNMNDYYMDYPIEDILYPSIIMANKYEYHLAYLNVYEALTSQDHKKGVSELENLDNKTREMALDYLKKGAEKGNKECKKILGNHYLEGKYIEKNVVKGNQLIKESGIE
jgi:TPR repeat protein